MKTLDIYIDPVSKAAIGNAGLGQSVFESPGSCGSSNCHGPEGLLNAGGTTLGELANDNPWEVLHKIRNGHPGSIMPSFVTTLSQAQIQNVLAHTQTLPTINTGTGTCTTDMASFVSTNIGNTTPWDGGQLYVQLLQSRTIRYGPHKIPIPVPVRIPGVVKSAMVGIIKVMLVRTGQAAVTTQGSPVFTVPEINLPWNYSVRFVMVKASMLATSSTQATQIMRLVTSRYWR